MGYKEFREFIENAERVEFEKLEGKTFSKIRVNKEIDEISFTTPEGEEYTMLHVSDCCESVEIDDICGDLDDLIDTPILLAEEATNSDKHPEGVELPEYVDDSFTWTFYKIATIKGAVTIRWFGTSNGYYSESVELYRDKRTVKTENKR